MASNWMALQARLKAGKSSSAGGKPARRKSIEKAAPRPAQAAAAPAATSAAPAAAATSAGGLAARLPPLPFRADGAALTDVLALDCEMVGVGPGGARSALAQVVLINSREELVYAAYVRPAEPVSDFRTAVSGIRPHHLARAVPFQQAQAEVTRLLYKRRLVGHALHNDLKALQMSHPKRQQRDTAMYAPFRAQGGPTSRARKLSDLARELLGMRIQQGEHSPLEDAVAALRLYKLRAAEWERGGRRLGRQAGRGARPKKRKRRPAEAAATAGGVAGRSGGGSTAEAAAGGAGGEGGKRARL